MAEVPNVANFEVLGRLGSGGMGEVFLARDLRLDRQVALKLLSEDLASDEEQRQRFLVEARAASALSHPNVAVIFEAGETEGGRPYIAMEHIEGKTLSELLVDGPLDIERAVAIAGQLAGALDAAHTTGIVHRDIKPANIMFTLSGDVKILDFGLAKLTTHGQDTTQLYQTGSGQILGTPTHMSPEQALGQPVDFRTDLFSLGVVLFEKLSGASPFAGNSFGETLNNIVHHEPPALARFNYSIPAELERITRKCLQKQADRRYQSMREIVLDLENLSLQTASGDVAAAVQPTVMSEAGVVTEEWRGESAQDYDIVIACAQIDDRPLPPKNEGWVSQLVRHLKIRLEQLTGAEVKIQVLPMPAGQAPSDQTIFNGLPDVKTLVSVVSPPFTKSEGVQKGVEHFWSDTRQSGEFRIADRPRLFKVVKSPVSPDEIPSPLVQLFEQLMAFEFFEEDIDTGRVREFDESFGDLAQQRYHEKIYDLAVEISAVLKQQELASSESRTEVAASDGLRIFLADTTSDIQGEHERLKRELQAQGHDVQPQRPLPLVADQIESEVKDCLEGCDLAIHMIGDRYGLVPEDSEVSLAALQNSVAAQVSQKEGVNRIIWMPRGQQARDQRQTDFLQQLREDNEAQTGADVIEDTLENLKQHLEEYCRRVQKQRLTGQQEASSTTEIPRLYLICDREDEEAVEPIEDWFFEQGVEVSLPAFEGHEQEISGIHWQNLTDCDAVLVYYGQAGKSWVDIKLRELIKAVGYREGREIAVRGVYVAPPGDRRKERFKTLSAKILRQEEEHFDPSVLNELLTEVKQAFHSSS